MENETQPSGADDFLWNPRASGGPRPKTTEAHPDLGLMSYHYAYVPHGGDYLGTDRYVNNTAYPSWHSGAFADFERHSIEQSKPASTVIMLEGPLGSSEKTAAVLASMSTTTAAAMCLSRWARVVADAGSNATLLPGR
jgi:hypothetical protein